MLRAWLSDLAAKDSHRGKPIAAGTVAQAYRTLTRVLTAAVDDELIGRNPLQGVKAPRVEPQPMRFLTHDDVASLAVAIDTRYRALVYVAAYAGLRAGELIALRRAHVDLLRRTITVVEQVQYLDRRHVVSPPKSAAGRRAVALPRLVADELDAHLHGLTESSPDAVVFPAPAGGYLHLENFRKRVWLPAVNQAGLAPLRIHDLRHTCASLAIAAGADVKVLQRDARARLRGADARSLRPPAPRAGGERGRLPRLDGAGRRARSHRRTRVDRLQARHLRSTLACSRL